MVVVTPWVVGDETKETMEREEKNVFAMLYVLPSGDWLKSNITCNLQPQAFPSPLGDYKVKDLKKEYEVLPINGDGNCLFRAVSKVMTDTQDRHLVFRKNAVDIALNNKAMRNYIADEWVESMRKPGVWGDFEAIQALCDFYQVCVRVLKVEDMANDDAQVMQVVWKPEGNTKESECVFVGDLTNVITLLLTGPGAGTHFEVLYHKDNIADDSP